MVMPPLLNNTGSTEETFRFPESTISWDLKWTSHIDKAQQKLYFLQQFMKFNLPQERLITFHTTIIRQNHATDSFLPQAVVLMNSYLLERQAEFFAINALPRMHISTSLHCIFCLKYKHIIIVLVISYTALDADLHL